MVTILLGADIDRPLEVRAREADRAFKAFVDIKERAGLRAVAPDLDLAAVIGARATLRQIAAGAFSLPPSQVPSGPKMLWYRATRFRMP